MAATGTVTIQLTTGATYQYPNGPHLPCLNVSFEGPSPAITWGGSTAAATAGVTSAPLPPYVATWTKPDGTSVTLNVGSGTQHPHWWKARWRFPTTFNVKNSIASLKALNLISDYGDIVASDGPPPVPAYSYPYPMSTGGVTVDEANTGERPDIGAFNEADAFAVITGDFTASIAYNSGLNSTAIFDIDERTGKFWDLLKYPLTSKYPNQHNDISQPWYITPGPAADARQIRWDTGHNPEAGYLPALVTEDTYWLELVQANAQAALIFSTFRYGLEKPYATMTVGQGRGYAYSWRNVIDAYLATKFFEDQGVPLSSMCQPSSFYHTIITNQLLAAQEYWISNPAVSKFSFAPDCAAPAPWQQDKINDALAFGVLNIPELKAYAEWSFNSIWWRVNGKSGWPPCMSSWYYLQLMPAYPVTGKSNVVDPRPLKPSDFLADAAAVWSVNAGFVMANNGSANVTPAQVQAALADQWNGGIFVQENTYDHFILHAAFAQFVKAMRLGKIDLSRYGTVAEIEQAYANIHQMAIAIDINNRIPSRTSILVQPVVSALMPPSPMAPLGTVAPPSTPPVTPPVTTPPVTTPPVQPPTGVPPMTTPDPAAALAALTTAVQDVSAKANASAAAVAAVDLAIQHAVTKINALIAASPAAGVDPAALTALVTQLTADSATLVANNAKLAADTAAANAA